MLKFYLPTAFWIAVNLLALYLVMKKFLFHRVTAFMENRTRSIRESIENAEKDKAEAMALKKNMESQLGGAHQAADGILNEARARAEREYESILATARKDAEALLVKAREEIDREREQALKDVKDQVASLALAAASKVMEANMDTESNRVLVEKFLDEAGAA